MNAELKYSKSHEWVRMLDDGTALVGITDYAQSKLGDIVFVTLPAAGDAVTAGEVYSTIGQLRAMEYGLKLAIEGLEQALDSFGGDAD